MQKMLYTIGYEGVTIEALVKTLKAAGVEVLLDVRAVPLSRKPGFSKNKLAERLAAHDITYVGLKGLGTPAEGREAARKGKLAQLRAIFTAHLETAPAVKDMEEALKIAAARPSCLLCFEHDPGCCHRVIVAERLTAQTKQTVTHLDPLAGSLL